MKAQVRKFYSRIRAIIQDLPKYLCFIFIKKKFLPSQTNEIRHNQQDKNILKQFNKPGSRVFKN